jgi:hypothetical protein
VKVWVVVCSDYVAGVASSQERADELYGCGHGQDSLCCWTEEREVDAALRAASRPARHRPPVIQEALPL